MKVALLLMSEGEMPPWDEQTPEQQAAAMRQHDDFGAACAAREGVTILAGAADGARSARPDVPRGSGRVPDGSENLPAMSKAALPLRQWSEVATAARNREDQ